MFDNKIVAFTARPGLIAGSGPLSVTLPVPLSAPLPALLYVPLSRHMPDNSAADSLGDLSGFSSGKLIGLVAVLFLCLALALPFHAEAAHGTSQDPSRISARAMFSLLPPSIFENTSEGLSDDEFDALVEEGRTEYWSISRESANDLVISAAPPVESKVVLHLFRSDDGGVVAALGSQSGIVCALEFWRYDGAGKIMPVAGPEQPSISDLFLPDHLPSHVDPTIMMCLEQDKVFAKPVLWSANGIVHEPQDFIVHYFWNGREFIKDRKAVQPLPSNPAPVSPLAPQPDAQPVTPPVTQSGIKPGAQFDAQAATPSGPHDAAHAAPNAALEESESVKPLLLHPGKDTETLPQHNAMRGSGPMEQVEQGAQGNGATQQMRTDGGHTAPKIMDSTSNSTARY